MLRPFDVLMFICDTKVLSRLLRPFFLIFVTFLFHKKKFWSIFAMFYGLTGKHLSSISNMLELFVSKFCFCSLVQLINCSEK